MTKRTTIARLIIIFDVVVFSVNRIIGIAYGKIGPSGIVNGIVLYYFLIKKKHWAHICFDVFTCLGVIIASVALLGRLFLPWESDAPLFGYANIVSGLVYIFTLVISKKL